MPPKIKTLENTRGVVVKTRFLMLKRAKLEIRVPRRSMMKITLLIRILVKP